MAESRYHRCRHSCELEGCASSGRGTDGTDGTDGTGTPCGAGDHRHHEECGAAVLADSFFLYLHVKKSHLMTFVEYQAEVKEKEEKERRNQAVRPLTE